MFYDYTKPVLPARLSFVPAYARNLFVLISSHRKIHPTMKSAFFIFEAISYHLKLF
jgi:hypothetical protein